MLLALRRLLSQPCLVTLIAGLLLITGTTARGEEKQIEHITLGTYYIPGLVENSTEGILIDHAHRIAGNAGIAIDIKFLPTKRIQKMFQAGDLTGYFPELDDHAVQNACKTAPLGFKTIFAFWRKGDRPPESISDLEDKTIGIVAGYSYGQAILGNPKIFKETVPSDELNIRKLLAGRLHYVIGDSRSTIAAIKKTKAAQSIEWQPDNPIASLPYYFLFKNHPKARVLCEKFTEVMHEGRRNGTIPTL